MEGNSTYKAFGGIWMQAKRAMRWMLAGVCLTLAAGAFGCASEKSKASLEATNPLVRKATVESLGAEQDKAHYDTLVDVLRYDPDRLVRSKAALAIGKLNERYFSVGFQPLAEAVVVDGSVFVRAAAATALSSTCDSRAVAVLVGALEDSARGELTVREGEHYVTYRACTADAARSSLEKVVAIEFRPRAGDAAAMRMEMAAAWQSWYSANESLLPSETALARK